MIRGNFSRQVMSSRTFRTCAGPMLVFPLSLYLDSEGMVLFTKHPTNDTVEDIWRMISGVQPVFDILATSF